MQVTKCGTIGCKLPATHVLVYSFPESRDETETDETCEFCADSYIRRPTLRAFALLLRTAKEAK
jgi:hypothetical protein